ncbi:hypothetical protein [Cytobacillus gottheilii]|uniref:Helix-hairpin-helix DNA-binding motif class 1 domain-containing protein n=1 Tax=Cytobacillus gottheilii TaxID=859144 RepID=A0ABX8FAA5_9BACI|nr:hypothetical protein [Cytobacillus gottheilii]QVY60954.1 hypothetical protein J1899_18585 [Cytobacillus gottheilii]
MGKALKQIKKDIAPAIKTAFQKGLKTGADIQRAEDAKHLMTLLEGLESVPGIGTKTAEKIRTYLKIK